MTRTDHPLVKLICGVLHHAGAPLSDIYRCLEDTFGSIDCESEQLHFDHTDYYRAEMGDVTRRFLSFERLVLPESLVAAKRTTIRLEDAHRNPSGGRLVNLDVGYLNAAKMILATTKDYAHRIYLGEGIFADLEYVFRDGAFHPLDWTYPEYHRQTHLDFFHDVRRRYLRQLDATRVE